MIGALIVLIAGCGQVDAPVEVARRAFVEVDTDRSSYFVNEPFVVRLRVGVEQTFLHDQVVQLFAQRLDVPVQVRAPWLAVFPENAPANAVSPARPTFALDDMVIAGTRLEDRIVDGKTFTVVQGERRVVVRDAGPFTPAAPRLVFAYATRFDDDLVRGHVALDRLEATIEGAPLALTIAPVPEAGRPSTFTGAIGRFTIRATASARAVDVGQSFTVTVTVEGDGNIAEFAAPAWDALDGFHVLGVLDRSEGSRRSFALDVAATRADVVAVPPIAFAFFDPAHSGSYVTVRSDAIPLTVRPRAEASVAEESAQTDPRAWIARVVSIAAVAALAIVALVMLRSRARARAAPNAADAEARRRAAGALAAFRTRIAADPRALEAALSAYLAARLRCVESEVIAADLDARLARAGAAPADAREATRVLEVLVASRYGGSPAAVDAASVTALVERIDVATRRVSE